MNEAAHAVPAAASALLWPNVQSHIRNQQQQVYIQLCDVLCASVWLHHPYRMMTYVSHARMTAMQCATTVSCSDACATALCARIT